MKRSKRVSVLTAAIVAGQSIASAQLSPAAIEDGSTELTISVIHETFRIGDPFTLHIAMKNMHKDKYCHHVINEESQAWLNGYVLEVTDSGGKTYPIKKQPRLRAGSTSGECIDHGKSTTETMDVNRLVDLNDPGTYHLRVSHEDKMTHQIVWSNTIAITISH